MSVYNSSYSGANDSDRTAKAKQKLTRIITEQMRERGFKTWVKEEVPATFLEPRPLCYHLDLGVLFRSIREFDFYHFFAIEIDWSVGHRTPRHDKKDNLRDEAFIINKGIVTCRIPLEKIFEERNDESRFFEKWIWGDLFSHYIIIPAGETKLELWSELNRQFSIQLKENAFTQCRNPKCTHKAHHHDLTGCSYRYSNKNNLRCSCTEPFFISDE